MAKAAQMVRGRTGVPAHLCSSPLSHLPQRRLQFNSGGSLPWSNSPHFTDEERVRRNEGWSQAALYPAYLGEDALAGGRAAGLVLHAGVNLSLSALQGLRETA